MLVYKFAKKIPPKTGQTSVSVTTGTYANVRIVRCLAQCCNGHEYLCGHNYKNSNIVSIINDKANHRYTADEHRSNIVAENMQLKTKYN